MIRYDSISIRYKMSESWKNTAQKLILRSFNMLVFMYVNGHYSRLSFYDCFIHKISISPQNMRAEILEYQNNSNNERPKQWVKLKCKKMKFWLNFSAMPSPNLWWQILKGQNNRQFCNDKTKGEPELKKLKSFDFNFSVVVIKTWEGRYWKAKTEVVMKEQSNGWNWSAKKWNFDGTFL